VSLEDGIDRWPTFELSPTEYERIVAELVRDTGHEVTDWDVKHLDPVEGVDGAYIIDVTVRFRLLGADYLTLFECKRHASPVKREDVQVLHDKLRSTGAHKGILVAASGFQKGALIYAKSTVSRAYGSSTVPGRTKSATSPHWSRSRQGITSPTRYT
jgi:restriction system protein